MKTRSRGVEVIDLSRPTFNQKPFRTELTAHLVIEVYEVRRLDAILTNMRGNKTRTFELRDLMSGTWHQWYELNKSTSDLTIVLRLCDHSDNDIIFISVILFYIIPFCFRTPVKPFILFLPGLYMCAAPRRQQQPVQSVPTHFLITPFLILTFLPAIVAFLTVIFHLDLIATIECGCRCTSK